VSSGGILFHAGLDLPVGFNVNLAVAWPVRLHDVAPMQLAVQGRIIRAANGWAAIRTAQHEFRTLGSGVDHQGGHANIMRAPGTLTAPGGGLDLRKLY
jgi:hypothetical protein